MMEALLFKILLLMEFLYQTKGMYIIVLLILIKSSLSHPEKVRYKVIGVEMKGMKSSMKLVALGATQRRG